MPLLADTARLVAPDLPGCGFSDAPPLDRYEYSFENIADTIDALVDVLGLERMFLYVHDYGAAVAYHLATPRPERVLGFIVQNGSAHDEGMGTVWDTARAFWADPSPENRAKLPDWLTYEGVREVYVSGVLRPIVPLELANVRLLKDAGVMLLAATDVGVPLQVPGISLHVELERLVEAGLTPLEALQAATLNPARVLRMADSLGTVEAGKLADLVLLDANPLEDIRNTRRILAVVAGGRLTRRAELDRLLAEGSAPRVKE